MYACGPTTHDGVGTVPQVQRFPPWDVNPRFPQRPEEVEWDTDMSGVRLVEGAKLFTFLAAINVIDILAARVAYDDLLRLGDFGEGGLPGGSVPVLDPRGDVHEYEWRAIPNFDLKRDADPERTIVARMRWDLKAPVVRGVVPPREVLPVPLSTVGERPPETWSPRIIVRQFALRPELGSTPPLFRIGASHFCTDEFYASYHEHGFTGLQFRKLEPTEAERNGEVGPLVGAAHV